MSSFEQQELERSTGLFRSHFAFVLLVIQPSGLTSKIDMRSGHCLGPPAAEPF
jgi:hypothetical protein